MGFFFFLLYKKSLQILPVNSECLIFPKWNWHLFYTKKFWCSIYSLYNRFVMFFHQRAGLLWAMVLQDHSFVFWMEPHIRKMDDFNHINIKYAWDWNYCISFLCNQLPVEFRVLLPNCGIDANNSIRFPLDFMVFQSSMCSGDI